MTSNRRGFSRERHTELKLLIAGLAMGGFALGWIGFARAHEPVLQAGTASTLVGELTSSSATPSLKTATTSSPPTPVTLAGALSTPVGTAPAQPAAPTQTPAPTTPVPAQPSASDTVAGGTTKPPAAPVSRKRSRGS